jgi:hypothetical protein
LKSIRNCQDIDHIPPMIACRRNQQGNFIFRRSKFSGLPIRHILIAKFDPSIICDKKELDNWIVYKTAPAGWPSNRLPICIEHFEVDSKLQKEIDEGLALYFSSRVIETQKQRAQPVLTTRLHTIQQLQSPVNDEGRTEKNIESLWQSFIKSLKRCSRQSTEEC